jgi:hypothetical protein
MCGEKCKWIKTSGEEGEEGVCTSSEVEVGGDNVNVGCWVLSKSICDKYLEGMTYIAGINVVDAPCFFNGRDDGSGYYCVTKSSLMDCGYMKTNSMIIDGEGNEMESCNDAGTLFEWPFMCSWLWNHNEKEDFCTTVYFLTENGLGYYFHLNSSLILFLLLRIFHRNTETMCFK